MKIQKISQSSIYKIRSRQDKSAGFLEGCRPKPKTSIGRGDFSMPTFRGRVNSKQAQTLLGEVGNLLKHTCNSVKESFNKSKTKQILIAPIQKKWSDFASKAPKAAQVVKGAFYVTAGAVVLDALTGEVLK